VGRGGEGRGGLGPFWGREEAEAMSQAFAYLSVLLSIVLGLAITEILQAWAALLRTRERVQFYLPPVIWSLIFLLITVQFWWVSFGLGTRANWNFGSFCSVFAQTVAIYVASALVLPKENGSRPIDLRAHYYREVAPLFALGLVFLAIGFIKDWLLHEQLAPLRLAASILFLILLVLLLTVRKPLMHEALAPTVGALMLGYFVVLFWRI
jgi:hypothetical protein